jgi:hypothetical protein
MRTGSQGTARPCRLAMEGIRGPRARLSVGVDDERRELVPSGAGEPEERPHPPTGRVVVVTAAAMLAPPGIAALAGSVGLSITLGMLSIFSGLVGFAVYAYAHEHWRRRPSRRFPRARARLRLRG